MAYDNTISGLLRKRDEMMGELAAMRERQAVLSNQIAAMDQTLDALGYEGDLEGRTPRSNRVVLFSRNELRQWLLRELRGAERPMSSRDLAERICAAEGRDYHDQRLVCDVVRRVSKACRVLRDRGVLYGERTHAGYLWSVE